MTKINFTNDQEKGINTKKRDLLLSASAGSGKTAVLVQRVISQILEDHLSIDQLLIVTFTEAAAEGMQKKIQKALIDNLNQQTDPNERKFLKEQLQKLPRANIQTLHAFCLSVIKRFYYVIDLDPSFSLLTDEVQKELLEETALNQVFEQHFTAADQKFIDLLNNFSTAKNIDGTSDLVMSLYEFAIAQPHPKKFLEKIKSSYQEPNFLTDIITNQLYPNLEGQITNLRQQIAIYQDPKYQDQELAKMVDALKSLDNQLLVVEQMLAQKSNFDELKLALDETNFVSVRKGKLDDQGLIDAFDYLKNRQNDVKEQITKIKENYFAYDLTTQKQLVQKSSVLINVLVNLTLEFIDQYQKIKRARNFLDFNDLEQLAYAILSSDTTNGKLAKDFYQHKFREIMVDEYQDTNDIQEAIIQEIKNPAENYLFMVGDVKQSIYGFRQAKPKLFIDKFNTYSIGDAAQQKINLMENFRSTKQVIKFVNHVFDQVLTNDFGEIDYQHEGELKFGAEYYQDNLPDAVEIALFNADQDEKSDENQDEIDQNEIQVVISRIKKMQANHFQVSDTNEKGERVTRDFNLNDVAILTRTKSNNFDILDQFTNAGLNVDASDAINYFQTFELNVILSYLKIIDNPDQDIPLVGVMRSPLYNFDENDFAKIRLNAPNVSFYQAVKNYHDDSDTKLTTKISDFLADLNELRNFQQTHRISELIWHIYEEKHLMEIVLNMPNGRQRRVNLQALYERANSYESAGFKGLYQFINFINKMRKKDKDLAQPLVLDEQNEAITLSTIHKSKGLEYPIVFLIDLNYQFNNQDLINNYLIDADLGLGINITDDYIKYEPLFKALLKDKKNQKANEEEARLLYVALTRAQQKLIIVLNEKKSNIENNGHDLTFKDNLVKKNQARHLADFIVPTIDFSQRTKISELTIADQTEKSLIITEYSPADFINDEDKSTNIVDQNLGTNFTDLETAENFVRDSYEFRYPFLDASKTTSYQAVSEIKQVYADPDLIQLQNAQIEKKQNRYLQPLNVQPDFLQTQKFSPAQKGTAIHLILQKHDFSKNPSFDELKNEVKKLVDARQIPGELAEQLNLEQVVNFLQSDLGQEISQNTATLKREISFSSLVKADQLFNDFSDPTSKILVHGTIDGYFIKDNAITLFDYKTDHLKNDPEKIKEFLQNYQGQLNFYQKALEEMYKIPVTKKYLIALSLDQTFELK